MTKEKNLPLHLSSLIQKHTIDVSKNDKFDRIKKKKSTMLLNESYSQKEGSASSAKLHV